MSYKLDEETKDKVRLHVKAYLVQSLAVGALASFVISIFSLGFGITEPGVMNILFSTGLGIWIGLKYFNWRASRYIDKLAEEIISEEEAVSPIKGTEELTIVEKFWFPDKPYMQYMDKNWPEFVLVGDAQEKFEFSHVVRNEPVEMVTATVEHIIREGKEEPEIHRFVIFPPGVAYKAI